MSKVFEQTSFGFQNMSLEENICKLVIKEYKKKKRKEQIVLLIIQTKIIYSFQVFMTFFSINFT